MSDRILSGLLLVVAGLAGTLALGRRRHDRHVASLRGSIEAGGDGSVFRSESVADLPPVARRYFARALADGSPLPGSARLKMTGRIGLRPGAPKMPFEAEQVISRKGLVWAARVGSGLATIVGDDSYFDGRGAMAWYVGGLVPVVRASGPDVSRSAAGRVALELAVMLPSALLPSAGAIWEELDEQTARVTLQVDGEMLQPVLSIGADGSLQRVEMPRWDVDAGDGSPGFVVWKADLDVYETFDGCAIPTRMAVTKGWGTPMANPFFEATVESASFRR